MDTRSLDYSLYFNSTRITGPYNWDLFVSLHDAFKLEFWSPDGRIRDIGTRVGPQDCRLKARIQKKSSAEA